MWHLVLGAVSVAVAAVPVLGSALERDAELRRLEVDAQGATAADEADLDGARGISSSVRVRRERRTAALEASSLLAVAGEGEGADECDDDLIGPEDNPVIEDNKISTSSLDPGILARVGMVARLNSPSGWVPSKLEEQWVQFDFPAERKITGVEVQGAHNYETGQEYDMWTKQFKIVYSKKPSGDSWIEYENGKVLAGNTDKVAIKKLALNDFHAYRVRILPTDWPNWGKPGMRAAFRGCDESKKASKSDQEAAKKILDALGEDATRGLKGVEVANKARFECFLKYCNTAPELMDGFCAGRNCTSKLEAAKCEVHWRENGKKEGRKFDPEKCAIMTAVELARQIDPNAPSDVDGVVANIKTGNETRAAIEKALGPSKVSVGALAMVVGLNACVILLVWCVFSKSLSDAFNERKRKVDDKKAADDAAASADAAAHVDYGEGAYDATAYGAAYDATAYGAYGTEGQPS